MQIQIEPTDKIVELEAGGGGRLPARLWEGTTDRGTPVHCFVTLIAPTIENPPAEVQQEFARSLRETRAPSAAVASYPLRLVL